MSLQNGSVATTAVGKVRRRHRPRSSGGRPSDQHPSDTVDHSRPPEHRTEIDADGETRRVAVSLGPEHGTAGPQQVKEATKEAVQGVGFDMLTDNEDPGGGRYFRNLKYRMVFQSVGADTTISGLVDLYLRDEAAGWSIYKWIDQQDGLGNATLGLVRWRQKVVY